MVSKTERKNERTNTLKPLDSGALPVVLTFGPTDTNETTQSAALSEI